MIKTIYLIKHEEYDNDLRRWEVEDGIAFVNLKDATEYISNKKDMFVEEIELIEKGVDDESL